jgi:SAM-dependent methyltransferase
MADESGRFHTIGPSWSERAKLGGLRTVLSPDGCDRRNLFLDGVHLFAANRVFRLRPGNRVAVDFGCGSGRFIRYFAKRGWNVIGTEITPEMIEAAERDGIPPNCHLCLTDGVLIPLRDDSVDVVWCCSVLRYSLLVADPVYDKIAAEMFRVLRPGGLVCNVEMYVDQVPEVFVKDFELAGFVTADMRVIQRDRAPLERLFAHRRWPIAWISWMAGRCAHLRYSFDHPKRQVPGLRDYLFVWEKPETK